MDISQITQLKASTSDRPASVTSSRSSGPDVATPFSDAMTRAKRAQPATDEPAAPSRNRDTARNERAPTTDSAQATPGDDSKPAAAQPTPVNRTAPESTTDPLATSAEGTVAAAVDGERPLASMSESDRDGKDIAEDMFALLSALPGLQPLTADGAQPPTGLAPQQSTAAVMGTETASLLRQVQAPATTGQGAARALPMDSQSAGDAEGKAADRFPALSLTDDTPIDPKASAAASSVGSNANQTASLGAAPAAPTNPTLAMLQTAASGTGGERQPRGELPAAFSLDASSTDAASLFTNPTTTGNGAPGVTPTATAPAGATIPVAVNSPQWPGAFGQQVLQLHQRGENRMELHLNPRDLGPVSVTLTVNDQQAQLHALSAHAGVRAAVEAAIPQLREALAQSGIALGEATVGDQGQPREQSERRDGGTRFAGQDAGANGIASEESLGDLPSRPITLGDSSNINLYA